LARILVAEDEETLRNLVVRALAQDGHEVVAASDGAEALELLVRNQGRFDLLLSDIRMPLMDGVTLARAAAHDIPRSRHNPKILWVDDAEIVGDRITKVRPIPRNLFTQKTERRIGGLGASCVALVVSDVSVHEAP